MSRKQDYYDEELDGFYEDDEDPTPLWQKFDEALEDGEEAVVVTPDRQVLKAERHRKKLLRQMKERETDARRYE